ncbi:hypothetical protein J7337_000158 [Fusarium musae]|uniref:Uncharacterized protein n=1 Tax=Fusarium musae TaxID=1042133 RepID=A0A9P8DRE5_9HYPO|nr:hypothetical protein J7337_000158 [Fusarium musae]KAG9506625.1 hypothetical protein J7337_000158 [Fusarium musae]
MDERQENRLTATKPQNHFARTFPRVHMDTAVKDEEMDDDDGAVVKDEEMDGGSPNANSTSGCRQLNLCAKR